MVHLESGQGWINNQISVRRIFRKWDPVMKGDSRCDTLAMMGSVFARAEKKQHVHAEEESLAWWPDLKMKLD